MGSIEQQSLKKKSHISFHVNGKLQTSRYINLNLGNFLSNRDLNFLLCLIVKDEYPLNATLGYYLRDVLKLTGYIFEFIEFHSKYS